MIIETVLGDITKQTDVEAIVNAANHNYLQMRIKTLLN